MNDVTGRSDRPVNMSHKTLLLKRLTAIAQVVKKCGSGLAMLSLGSAGQELSRLDEFSDLDFFVIARPGQKSYFLDSLNWLEEIQPITFSFRNTADGYKLLFEDGIFCETAVFEAYELTRIPFTNARVIWQDEKSSLNFPLHNSLPAGEEHNPNVEWLTGEILSNLYVGLGRFRRGERLTAARFVQGYAVDRIVELAPFIEMQQDGNQDPFDQHRRFEHRYPQTASKLPQFLPGYEQTPQAVRAILAFIGNNFSINQGMKQAILALCTD